MRRREFIKVIAGSAATWPLVASAQQPAMPVIGFLNGASPQGYARYVAAFRDGLREAGYFEGQNVAIEYRWAEGNFDRLPDMAADLVRRQVAVIVANTPANLIAKAATKTVPIVFTTGSDPVQIGLVDSLSRPGSNATGVTQLTIEVGSKRLELAHELMPSAMRVALLLSSNSPTAESVLKDAKAASLARGLQLQVLLVSTDQELEAAFAGFSQLQAGVLVIGSDVFMNDRIQQIAALSLRYAVPAIYAFHDFAAAGGLMSYGGSLTNSYRIAGVYTAKILRGEKPADLPVQQSNTVELIVNLKTAKALGITIPISLLGRADEIIE